MSIGVTTKVSLKKDVNNHQSLKSNFIYSMCIKKLNVKFLYKGMHAA